MKKIFSKKAAYLPSIIFVTMLVTIAVCCDPPSLVGRSALIRLAVTIPLNILFQISLYILAAALLFIAFHYLLRERSNGCLNAGVLRAYISLVLAVSNQALTQKSASSRVTQSENPRYTILNC